MEQEIIKRCKEKRAKYCNEEEKNKLSPKLKYVKGLISRILLTVIFVLGSVIFTNISSTNKELYEKYVLLDTLSFTKINNLYKKFLGNVDIIKNKEKEATVVFNNINYSNIEEYKNGVKLSMARGEAINVITSGIVVYIGDKDELGSTVIVQGNDGADIWYSGITDENIQVYDYVEAGNIIGVSSSDYIILTIMKNGAYISYDEYQNKV